MSINDSSLKVKYIEKDFDVADLDNSAWSSAETVVIDRHWSGESAPEVRYFTAKLLWSDEALYARFEAEQHEPLVVSDTPKLSKKSIGLWDRDVCEIFVAPDAGQSEKYFEFEVAPTGEWLDVSIEMRPDRRNADWDYRSGMTVATRIETNKVISAIRIPWSAFDRKPSVGDEWRGNLYRCVGRDPTRGYVAWQPTMTPEPNFHVPERFGEFLFIS